MNPTQTEIEAIKKTNKKILCCLKTISEQAAFINSLCAANAEGIAMFPITGTNLSFYEKRVELLDKCAKDAIEAASVLSELINAPV
jgi:hypothetical protein